MRRSRPSSLEPMSSHMRENKSDPQKRAYQTKFRGRRRKRITTSNGQLASGRLARSPHQSSTRLAKESKNKHLRLHFTALTLCRRNWTLQYGDLRYVRFHPLNSGIRQRDWKIQMCGWHLTSAVSNTSKQYYSMLRSCRSMLRLYYSISILNSSLLERNVDKNTC